MESSLRPTAGTEAADAWPADRLQAVPQCPVCGSSARRIIHSGLRDRVFFAAPGEWALWCCDVCACGYLDPRPDPESIHLAYANYFTHRPDGVGERRRGRLHQAYRWIERGVKNRYWNRREGFSLRPAIPGGAFLMGTVLRRRRDLAHEIRHLPVPATGGEQLLDVGCGNGAFLKTAKRLGFDAVGVEFDEGAAVVARQSGCDVFSACVPGSGLPRETFSHVTMNHVIEHLHDPLGALVEIFGLLKEGGRIWIKTPNIDSVGHASYGSAWRGLEPPRHLVLFGPKALVRVLAEAGFTDPRILQPELETEFYFRSSDAIASGRDPYKEVEWSRALARVSRVADRYAARHPERGESITVIAWKGHASA